MISAVNTLNIRRRNTFPRLAPLTLLRGRLMRWFANHEKWPVCYVWGPGGSGKTTAVLSYLQASERSFIYASEAERQEPELLAARLAGLYREAPMDIVLDEVGSWSAVEQLSELLPRGLRLIAIGKSGPDADLSRLELHGLMCGLSPDALAFTRGEAEGLAEIFGVRYVAEEIASLVERSGGLAVVVAAAIRSAAAEGRPLDAGSDSLEAVTRRLLRRAASVQGRTKRASGMRIRLFGRYSATVDGRRVSWVRRRDQQLFNYILLQPSARASREDLVTAFWPGTARALALQSLRTTCSTIRRALGAVVGPENVDQYFTTDRDIALNTDRITADAVRFAAHVESGDRAYDRLDVASALRHYRAALRLRRGTLFEGYRIEAPFDLHARRLDEMHRRANDRLVAWYAERGDLHRAADYCAHAEDYRFAYSTYVKVRA